MKAPKSDHRPAILTYMAYYLPGYKAGGALRTLQGLVEGMGDAFDFRIITRDRDLNDEAPYPGIETDAWQPVGKAQVCYLAPDRVNRATLREIARETPHDLAYFASFLDPRFTIDPLLSRRLGQVPRVPSIVAPQNELSPGALSLKAPKKKAFIAAARLGGLYRDCTFHASSELERDEILAQFPNAEVVVARNLQTAPSEADAPAPAPKEPGALRAIFMSRISAKKNLAGALRMLGQLPAEARVEIDVYGPVDDPPHWEECQGVIASMPGHVTVNVCGPLENHRIPEVMPNYHLFMLPTLGESFGYAILEAMLWGCPVLISDRTPWEGLEAAGAGWDIPLEDAAGFQGALAQMLALDGDGFAALSRSTRQFAFDYVRESAQIDENQRLFLDRLGPVG